jgi:hypothetical protein
LLVSSSACTQFYKFTFSIKALIDELEDKVKKTILPWNKKGGKKAIVKVGGSSFQKAYEEYRVRVICLVEMPVTVYRISDNIR